MRSPAAGPQRRGDGAAAACSALLADYSLGIAAKELGELEPARAVIPPGARVHVGFRDSEDLAMRVSTARAIKRSGFVPVPVIAARRLLSERMLREYLDALRTAGAGGRVLVVAGDPAQPRGPYPDTASVIGSGVLEEHGVRQVSVAGHPGGHPAVADGVLWPALAGKAAMLGQRGLSGSVVTQFGFDAALVLAWLAGVRARGISLPVRVGLPGPASVRLLLSYASRCGVSVSAPVARAYGFSLTEPAATAAPDRFIRALASGYDARVHGEVKLHFNAFGGFAATAEWIGRFNGHHPRLRFEDFPGAEGQPVEPADEGGLVVDLDPVPETAADLQEPSGLDGEAGFLADLAGDDVLVPFALVGVAAGETPIAGRRARAGGGGAGRALRHRGRRR